MKMTNWKKILGLVSERSIGDIVTRKELITLIYDPQFIGPQTGGGVDSSRCLLSKVGVLEIKSPGIYVKKKSIKPTWSMFELEKLARSWKGWFLELD